MKVELALPTGKIPLDIRLQPIDVRPDRWQKASVIGTIINSLTVIALAIGLGLTYQANRQTAEDAVQQQQLDRQAQVSDRFSKAIEQLGSAQLDIRLGGIYGLDRLMKDSPSDQPIVVEVLSAYVRSHAPLPTNGAKGPGHPTADVQAALTVLSRRAISDPRNAPDLTYANMAGANLRRAHLESANLTGADLENAHLTGADLLGANLGGANLHGADLENANLAGAYLARADLSSAALADANLTRAVMVAAHLTDAALIKAILSGAHLEHADLTGTDLSGARLEHADLTAATGVPDWVRTATDTSSESAPLPAGPSSAGAAGDVPAP